MFRADKELAFLLKYENVAWYENGKVSILDRRIYPQEIKFVECKNHIEVSKALADMVTQSGGPYIAVNMGMVLVVDEAKDLSKNEYIEFINKAVHTLCYSRPTTVVNMIKAVERCYKVSLQLAENRKDAVQIVFEAAIDEANKRYQRYEKVAKYLYEKIPKDGTIMTHCFGETVIGMLMRICKENNNDVKVICSETRPYFQGARLTASVIKDMGFDVTVITDNMPGYVMKLKNVDLFTSAADVITMDGHVINKIGTFQMALAAHYWGIPYFTTGIPNNEHLDISSVEIEERNGDYVTQAMGVKTTMDGVKGFYPAFDITPPKLISGIVTDKGIYSPYNLNNYYDEINKIKTNAKTGRFDKYFLMNENDVLEYVKEKVDFFEETSNLDCKEIGDGNLNYVFRVIDKNSNKSLILKHSSVDTRSKSGRKLNLDRNILECNILQLYNKYCPGFAPKIYMSDEVMSCYAMEDLSKYTIMRTLLLQNKTFPHFADNITTFMVDTLLPTTDIILNHKEKKELVKRHINPNLSEISEQLVFTDPFGNYSGGNIVLDSMKDFVQENLYNDMKLKLEVSKLKFNFMNNAQALLHGDLHTGSIFINEVDIKIIDPEFSFYGPIGYDVGNVIANLFLAWGHGYATIENKEQRLRYLSNIEKCIIDIVDMFKEKFIKKFKKEANDALAKTEGFEEWYLNGVMEDTCGSVGLETIRRIVGIAKVQDITSIKDEKKRTNVEKILILIGKEFIINRSQYNTGKDFIQTLNKYSKY